MNNVKAFAEELRAWGCKPDDGEDFKGVEECIRKALAILRGLRENPAKPEPTKPRAKK